MSDVAGIYAHESSYLDRYVQVGIAQGRVISVSFPETPDEGAEADHDLLNRIDAYLDGVEETFEDVQVALTVPTDQRKILESVREIPYGQDSSVAQLVRMTPGLDDGSDDDIRAVREALTENPAPLLIPDHRVRDGPGATPPAIVDKLRSIEGI
ncbi:methylated-DNA-[protein]-cysteine S-methyltransferase [Halorientalis persicus]|jgi:methylated-DNA-[protein]-cysteine S-methyltransferase|uniref:Methylated-DNA-[protein]-cysteine S-methyltransferase n=1 Tax=Halorientalis persicus TaxID=1367881 RepID=A0A1H8F5B6_9EURY|nr:MGMT family protein [Halorientalis persicus]SEN26983.1 methylated-DNA-[protein]-cysteine S-methyltransferase [Halorientalis persicus]